MSFALDKLKLPSFSKAKGLSAAARGGTKQGRRAKSVPSVGSLKPKQVTYVFRHLSTLLENGVSLPKALTTLAEEQAAESYRSMLESLRKRLENGESFSGALAHYPTTFDAVLVSQVKVGERAGNLGEALRHPGRTS